MKKKERLMENSAGERRHYPRFRVKDGALAFIGAVPGEISDVCLKGISITYVPLQKMNAEQLQIDIFVPEQDFYLPGISCRLVSEVDCPAGTPFQVVGVKRLSVEFTELSRDQQLGLEYFLEHNTVSCNCR